MIILKICLGLKKHQFGHLCYTGVQTWVIFVLVTINGSVKLSFRKASISKSVQQV